MPLDSSTSAAADDWITPPAAPPTASHAVDDWMSPPPEDTGILGAAAAGFEHAALPPSAGLSPAEQTTKNIQEGKPASHGLAEAFTRQFREPGEAAPTPPPKTIAEQPVELGDLIHPGRLAEKMAYQLSSSATPMAAGISAGAGATEAAAPLGAWAPLVGLGAGAVAYGVTSAVQQIGPLYADELAKDPKDPEGAWSRSLGKASQIGAFGTLGWAAFGVAPFASTVKNLVFQAFVVQPGIGIAEKATQNAEEGKPLKEGLGDAYASGVAGTAVPILGVEGARYAARRIAGSPAAAEPGAQSQPQPTPTVRPTPTATLPPEVTAVPVPPIGTPVNVSYPEGIRAATIIGEPQPGMVELQHANGTKDLIAADDLAKRLSSAPAVAGEVPPWELAGISPEEWYKLETRARIEEAAKQAAPVEPPAAAAVPPAEVRPIDVPPTLPPTAPTPAAQQLPEDPLHDLWQASEEAHKAAATGQPATDVTEKVETATAELEKQAEPEKAREVEPEKALGVEPEAAPTIKEIPQAQMTWGEALEDARARLKGKGDELFHPDEEMEGIALERGIPTSGMTRDEFFDEYARQNDEETIGGQIPLLNPENHVSFVDAQKRLGLSHEDKIREAREARPIETTATEIPPRESTLTVAPEQTLPFKPIRDAEASTTSGTSIPVEYAIVDAHDLITSHDDNLRENPVYPQELQPRDRTRLATADQITDFLRPSKFRPELLGESADAANGAPLVGPEGFVDSGNMRTMALRRAYDEGLPAAKAYRDFLESKGYPIEGVDAPMLVRIGRSDADLVQRAAFNVEANIPAQAAMSATEQAQADARRIPPGVLNLAVNGDLTTPGNRRFARAMLDNISSAAERGALMDTEGGLSTAGVKRLQAALLAKAYDDPVLISALTEDPEPNIKTIGNALLDASPAWARMRAAIAEGRIPAEADITPNIAAAAKLVAQARGENQKIVDFVNQRDMLGGGVDPITESILRQWMFEGSNLTRRVGRDKIADALNAYAAAAQREPGLLDMGRRTPVEEIESAGQKARGAAADLFAARLGEPGGPASLGEGAGPSRPEIPGQAIAAGGLEAPPTRPGAEPLTELGKEARAIDWDTAFKALATNLESRRAPRDTRQLELGLPPLQENSRAPKGDRLGDYQDFLRTHSAGSDPQRQIEVASDWVRNRGGDTKTEYLAMYDPLAGIVTHATTDALRDNVNIPKAAFPRVADANANLVIVHNHPSGRPLSRPDLTTLSNPGVQSIIAVGHAGEVSGITLTPEVRQFLNTNHNIFTEHANGERPFWSDLLMAVESALSTPLRKLVDSNVISRDQANLTYNNLVPRILDAAGLAHYVGSHLAEIDGLPDSAQTFRKIVNNLAPFVEKAFWAGHEKPNGSVADRLDRSTLTLRPDEAMATLSGSLAETAPERLGEERDRIRGETPGAEPGPLTSRLSLAEGALTDRLTRHLAGEPRPEEPADPDAHVAADAMAAAGDPKNPGSFGRLEVATGLPPSRQADSGAQKFAVFQRFITLPMTAGRRDEIQNAKWQAINATRKDRAVLLDQSISGLKSWRDAPEDSWHRVLAAAEIATLQNREVPLDGRRIILRNDEHPFAEKSKPGDIIALSPEETQMFADLRGSLDKVHENLVTTTARLAGWTEEDGPATAEAIYKAAQEAGAGTSKGERLKRAAAIVAAVEAKYRTSYLPLMRKGDYFFRVTPREGTEAKVGIPGWTGDGMPPTAMFRLINSDRWYENLAGGQRGGSKGLTKNAQAELERLQGMFPETEYHIDHGYLFNDPKSIRDLNMPAVDKLMMLASADAKSILESSNRDAGMDSASARGKAADDWKTIRNELINKILESRTPGFKEERREIPGYEGNFGESLGRYFHWLSSHTANLQNARAMDAANERLDNHPDPKTRAFWRDYDRAQEDYGDSELYGPLARLRQANFYMMLGGNMASTAKIMLHGMFLGMPVLSTGLDRGNVAATYANAFRQLVTPGRGLKIGRNGFETDLTAGALDERERALLRSAEAEGVVHAQGFEELGGLQPGGFENLTPTQQRVRKFFQIWGSNISAADRTIRGAQLFAAYRTANRVGMDAINRVWDQDPNWQNAPEKTPEEFAKFMVDRAAGVWGSVNRMPLLRSPAGQLVGQYRSYELNYLSVLNQMLQHMGPEGKMTAALMMGGLFAFGGALAVPFSQNLVGAANWAWKTATDVDPDFQNKLKDMMNSGWFDGAGDIVMHGAARKLMGIDWGSIGFGDIASRNLQSPADLFGAAISSTFNSLSRAGERWNTDQGLAAASYELMPHSIQHLLAAAYPEIALASAAHGHAAMSPSQLSEADRMKMAFGFQPEARAQAAEKQQQIWHLEDATKTALGKASDRVANLRARDLPIDQALKDWYAAVQQGVRNRVLTPALVDQEKRALAAKIQQRLRPDIGSKTERRIGAGLGQP